MDEAHASKGFSLGEPPSHCLELGCRVLHIKRKVCFLLHTSPDLCNIGKGHQWPTTYFPMWLTSLVIAISDGCSVTFVALPLYAGSRGKLD
jgi:hypothetical protein